MSASAHSSPVPQTVLALELVSPQLECRPDEKRTQLLVVDRSFTLALNFQVVGERAYTVGRFASQVVNALKIRSRTRQLHLSRIPLWLGRPVPTRRQIRIEVGVKADLAVRWDDRRLVVSTGEVQLHLGFKSDREVHRFVSVLNSWYVGQMPMACAEPSA